SGPSGTDQDFAEHSYRADLARYEQRIFGEKRGSCSGVAHSAAPCQQGRAAVMARSPSNSFPRNRSAALLLTVVLLVLFAASSATAQTRRLVILKLDGLPNDVVDHFVRQRDPRTGKSELPWFDFVFYQHGTRLTNFYVRGMSLSGPSWSM